jgi:hypothetical protein
MSPEDEERFRRILDDYMQRPGGDYAELLRAVASSRRRASTSRAGARRSAPKRGRTRSAWRRSAGFDLDS